jgi:hypothetical protein
MRSSYKLALTTVISFALVTTLSACGAGPDAPTRMISKVTDGAEGNISTEGNDIVVRNLLAVAQEDGRLVLVGTVVNQGENEDALLGLAVNGVQATFTGKSSIAQNETIIFEGASSNAKAVISGITAAAGTNIAVTLFFAKAGEITLNAIVRDKRDTYAGVTA